MPTPSSVEPSSQELGSQIDATQSEEFPQQQSVGPTVQHVIGTRPDPASPTPQFPLTSLSSSSLSPTSANPSSPPLSQRVTTVHILPRPSSTPASVENAEFPRLPVSSLIPTTTTTQASNSQASNEEFERLTQVVESSTERITDHNNMGPKHSMEGQGENGKSRPTRSNDMCERECRRHIKFKQLDSESQPEFHTVGAAAAETPAITTTLITLKNTTDAKQAEKSQAENRTERQDGGGGGGNWTWIIALIVIGGKFAPIRLPNLPHPAH